MQTSPNRIDVEVSSLRELRRTVERLRIIATSSPWMDKTEKIRIHVECKKMALALEDLLQVPLFPPSPDENRRR
jgi:hypothetical protein